MKSYFALHLKITEKPETLAYLLSGAHPEDATNPGTNLSINPEDMSLTWTVVQATTVGEGHQSVSTTTEANVVEVSKVHLVTCHYDSNTGIARINLDGVEVAESSTELAGAAMSEVTEIGWQGGSLNAQIFDFVASIDGQASVYSLVLKSVMPPDSLEFQEAIEVRGESVVWSESNWVCGEEPPGYIYAVNYQRLSSTDYGFGGNLEHINRVDTNAEGLEVKRFYNYYTSVFPYQHRVTINSDLRPDASLQWLGGNQRVTSRFSSLGTCNFYYGDFELSDQEKVSASYLEIQP